jgi:hypothetical protein
VHRSIAATAAPVHLKDTTTRFDAQRLPITHAAVDRKFRNTTNAIAAHHAFASVSVKHTHAHIRGNTGRYWIHHDEAVATDSNVSVTHPPSKRRWIFHRMLRTIDVHVVIAKTMHLDKADRLPTWSFAM